MAVAPVITIRPQSLFEITERLTELLDTIDMCEDADVRAECESEIMDVLTRQMSKIDRMAEYVDSLEFSIALRKKQVQLLEKANRRAAAILDRSREASHVEPELAEGPSPLARLDRDAVVPAQAV